MALLSLTYTRPSSCASFTHLINIQERERSERVRERERQPPANEVRDTYYAVSVCEMERNRRIGKYVCLCVCGCGSLCVHKDVSKTRCG